MSETKLDEKRLSVFKQKLDLGNMVAVDGVGKGGLQCFGGVESTWFFGALPETTSMWRSQVMMGGNGGSREFMGNPELN